MEDNAVEEKTGVLKLGLVQMCSTDRHAGNIAFAQEMVADAASQGCQMVAFPEVAGMMNRRLGGEPDLAGPEASDPFIAACCEMAARFGIWIHTGSTPLSGGEGGRFLNHSNLIDGEGRIVAGYDKIHLFDMYPEDGPPIVESKRYAPGAAPVLTETPWGRLGMSICYDLRFPQLYRDYAKAGASMLFIPSAFTVPTGRAHWDVLLRARAIENGAFVVAAAQVGRHDDGRETYGHSLVVDPWGRVLADMGERVGLEVVSLEMSDVDRARARIPSLSHDRDLSSDGSI